MIILGIDPGARNLGWGVIHCGALGAKELVSFGAFDLGPRQGTIAEDNAIRSALAGKHLVELVNAYGPSEVALESFVYFGPGARTTQALQMGHVLGRLRSVLETCELPVTEYTTRQIKHVITSGKKGAQKADVENYLRVLFRLPQKIRPSHAADAIAVAVCHAVKGALAMHVRAAIGGKKL